MTDMIHSIEHPHADVIAAAVAAGVAAALERDRQLRRKGQVLIGGLAGTAIALAVGLFSPPAKALFGIGDTVFDPIVNSTALKQVVQGIQQVQHLYNIYNQGQRMLNNFGSGNIAGAMNNVIGIGNEYGYQSEDLKTIARVTYNVQGGNYIGALVSAGELTPQKASVVQSAVNMASAGSNNGKVQDLFALGRALDNLDKTGTNGNIGRQQKPIGQSVVLSGGRPSFEAFSASLGGSQLPASMSTDPLAARAYSRSMLGPTGTTMGNVVATNALMTRRKVEAAASRLDAHGMAIYHEISSSLVADRVNKIQAQIYNGGQIDLQGQIAQQSLINIMVVEELASLRNLVAAQVRMEAAVGLANDSTASDPQVVGPLIYSGGSMGLYQALDQQSVGLTGPGNVPTPGSDGTVSWTATPVSATSATSSSSGASSSTSTGTAGAAGGGLASGAKP